MKIYWNRILAINLVLLLTSISQAQVVKLSEGQVITIGGTTVSCEGESALCLMTNTTPQMSCSGLFIVDSNGTLLNGCSSFEEAQRKYLSFIESGVCNPMKCRLGNQTKMGSCSGFYILNYKNEPLTNCMAPEDANTLLKNLRNSGVCK